MRGNLRWVGGILRGPVQSRGQLLIEVLIALAILGLISVVFIGAMYTSLDAARVADERSNALTLAKSQIEFVRAAGYSADDNNWDYTVTTGGWTATTAPSWLADKPSDYAVLPEEYEGYSVTVSGVSDIDLDGTGGPDAGIRTITSVVSHQGTIVFTLENYEVDR